jgi:hypothetical protein
MHEGAVAAHDAIVRLLRSRPDGAAPNAARSKLEAPAETLKLTLCGHGLPHIACVIRIPGEWTANRSLDFDGPYTQTFDIGSGTSKLR